MGTSESDPLPGPEPAGEGPSRDKVIGSFNGVPMNTEQMTQAFKDVLGMDVKITAEDVD